MLFELKTQKETLFVNPDMVIFAREMGIGEVEISYLSGKSHYMSVDQWLLLKPLLLTDTSKDWHAEALRLEEENQKLREALRQMTQPSTTQTKTMPDPTREILIPSENWFADALRASIGDYMKQPADTPPPPHQVQAIPREVADEAVRRADGGPVAGGRNYIVGEDKPLPPAVDPDSELVNIIRVERGDFHSKTAGKRCPMWRMFTDDGRQVNAFDHTDPLRDQKPLLIESGYFSLFMNDMVLNETRTWNTSPIQARIKPDGQFWKLVSLDRRGDGARPDPKEDLNDPYLTMEQVEVAAEAKRLINDKSVVFLDTESTGLNKDSDQPIEIAVIDAEGNRLFHRFVKPSVDIDEGALAVHKITPEMLADKPMFEELHGEFMQVIEGKRVLAYNVEFDLAMLRNVGVHVEYSNCVADLYNRWAGETYPNGRVKKHKLSEACAKMSVPSEEWSEHTALGDAQRARLLLKSMADYVPADPDTPIEASVPGSMSVEPDDKDIPF